jgi:hypothetical protein
VPGLEFDPVNNPALTVAAHADRPPQCPGVDQNRNDGLSHADQSEHEKLRIVENSKVSHTGCPKSEKQDLYTCDCAHQDGFDRVVNPGMGYP